MTDKPGEKSRFRRHQGALGLMERIFLTCIPIAGIISILDIFLYRGISVYTEQYLATILAFTLGAVFLIVPATKSSQRDRVPWYDLILSTVGLSIGFYVVIFFPSIALSSGIITPDRIIMGVLAILVILEATRRLTGWPLVIVICVFILYAHFSYLCPGPLYARGSPWLRIFTYLYLDNNAMTGIPLEVTGTVVLSFVIFGGALFRSGGGQFLSDIAMSLMGQYRGGAAKVAVVASSLFGSMSGSAVANVATTGVVTIPLMKRIGYSPHFAAAVEATASTGGQMMPPVMGAAAFLMAQFLGLRYVDVALAALIPAILYYLSVFLQVDLRAASRGLTGLPRESLPSFQRTMINGWIFIIPLLFLIYALFVMFVEPADAGLYATAALIILCGFSRSKRISPRRFLQLLERAGEGLIEVLVVAAAAGLLIGVITLTGLGFSFSLSLVQVSGGNFFVLLLLAAGGAILLGMGMTVTAAYILVVILIAPAIIDVGGIQPLGAHMFVFYFAVASFLTPPVCLAVYAAASIANTDSMKTAVQAMALAIAAYVVPFAFVYNPELLMIGSALDLVLVNGVAILGILLIAVGLEGYFFYSLHRFERMLAILAGLGMFFHAWSVRGVAALLFLAFATAVWKKSRTINRRVLESTRARP